MSLLNPPSIYVVGAQCTGKTTLINKLQFNFETLCPSLRIEPPQIISEVARMVLKENSFATVEIRNSPTRSLELQKLILAAQVEAEKEALSKGSWFISDRSGVDPTVYARRFVGKESAKEMEESVAYRELVDRMVNSLIVVCEAGASWGLKDDGVRLMPVDREEWLQFHQEFCAMLEEKCLPYMIIPMETDDLALRAELVCTRWCEMLTIRN